MSVLEELGALIDEAGLTLFAHFPGCSMKGCACRKYALAFGELRDKLAASENTRAKLREALVALNYEAGAHNLFGVSEDVIFDLPEECKALVAAALALDAGVR